MRAPIFYLVFISLALTGFSCSDGGLGSGMGFGSYPTVYHPIEPSGPYCELSSPLWIRGKWKPAEDYSQTIYWNFWSEGNGADYSRTDDPGRDLCNAPAFGSGGNIFSWSCTGESICSYDEYINANTMYVLRKSFGENVTMNYLIFKKLSDSTLCFSFVERMRFTDCERPIASGPINYKMVKQKF